MREFFINWSEKLVGVFVVLMMLGVVVGGFGIMASPSAQGGGIFAGLMVLIFGGIYAILMGGMFYLFFGVYRNTEKTNVLLEELLRK